MGGVDVGGGGGGKGKRRATDSEINMIPMIDLLMVTISFLLITAVWVHSQRMQADAQVPGSPPTTPPCGDDCKEDAKLHVQTADPANRLPPERVTICTWPAPRPFSASTPAVTTFTSSTRSGLVYV